MYLNTTRIIIVAVTNIAILYKIKFGSFDVKGFSPFVHAEDEAKNPRDQLQ
jgi:hypothetical protein